eukprot:c20257_g1_i4.p1 GENE.c20257_g1_i4~~c20257_g1_i4.p1  ORF type:complete len:312 (+),score=74.32 c20257_g1_i4:39-974(+)
MHFVPITPNIVPTPTPIQSPIQSSLAPTSPFIESSSNNEKMTGRKLLQDFTEIQLSNMEDDETMRESHELSETDQKFERYKKTDSNKSSKDKIKRRKHPPPQRLRARARIANPLAMSLKLRIDQKENFPVLDDVYNLFDEIFELEISSGIRAQIYSTLIRFCQFAFFRVANKVCARKFHYYATGSWLLGLLEFIRRELWPPEANDVFFILIEGYQPTPKLTDEEKKRNQEIARKKFMSVMPSLGRVVIGERNTTRAFSKLFEIVQRPTLIKTLVFKVLDEILVALFPDAQDELSLAQQQIFTQVHPKEQKK